jgi:hypothetical protein
MEASGVKLFSTSELITVARAALFLTVAICLMGPLASDTLFPSSPDHPNHAAAIVQARQAIEEGQFPLRIAPWQHGGWRYPQFQFYSWVPYWVGGLLHKHFFAENPWAALKWVYILALWFAGMCMHSAFRRLGLSNGSSLAGSFVYVSAPYVLTNMYSRGAFTEVIAQAELPLAFWGLVNILDGSSRRLVLGFAAVSFSVYLLANTHIITFAYGLFFLIIFSGILLAIRVLSPLRAGILTAAMIAGCLLAAHQLIPILTASELAVRALLSSPMAMQHLSPLGLVMSLRPAAPYLSSGEFIPDFWPQAGLPTLSAACLAVFLLVTDPLDRSTHKLTLCAALACLVLSILTASATIDIWRLLPSEAFVLQFPYRLMTFAALFGAIVAGISAHIGEPKFKSLPMGVVAVAILSAAIWQPKMEPNGRTVAQVLESPDLGYGSAAYLVSKAAVLPSGLGMTVKGPVIHSDGWLNLAAKLHFSAAQLRQSGGVLLIAGRQAGNSKGCAELHVKVGENTIVVPARMTEFTATVPANDLLQAARGASEFEVGFDSPCAFVPGPHDPRRLFMYATELQFLPNSPELNTILRADAGNICKLKGAVLHCEVQSTAHTEIQLPLLYYPKFLSVKVNGTETSIRPVERNDFVLTRVALPAGKSTVTAEFVGSVAGNYISLAGFLCWVIGIPLVLKRFADREEISRPLAASGRRARVARRELS